MKPADLLPPELATEAEEPLLDSAAQLEQDASLADLEDVLFQRIKHAEREISVNLPLLRDSGAAITCTGILVQHSTTRGASLAPVLFAPDIHLGQLRALALHFTLQCALLDLPLGGGAAAIVCDPAHLSETELRRLVEDYLWALRDVTGTIFAPADFIGAWTHRLVRPAALAGKPTELGGIPDLPAAIAAGWLALISEAVRIWKFNSTANGHQPLAALRVALQGFGPSAAALAHLLCDHGARIVALADKSGGLLAERGLDLAALREHAQRYGILYGFPNAEPARNSEVLESDCDLLISAAAERQINAQNASRIRAPLVLEAFYNSVTPAAARVLESRGTNVIPSLLAAAPATLAWTAEWQHALRASPPVQDEAELVICEQLAGAFQNVRTSAASRNLSLPQACRLLALEKLARILRLTR